MRFSVLGPLQVERGSDEGALVLPRRQRQVLARLLLSPNRVVPTERILDDLWAEPGSPGARASLHAQLSRLRVALGDPGVIESSREGYRVCVGPDALDGWHFEALLGDGRNELLSGRPQAAAERLGAALALWRGAPFLELADVGEARPEIVRLLELHTIASIDWAQADLDAGRPEEALVRAEALGADHRFDERIWALRITTRYACGRSRDALDAYEQARRALRDELGLTPGAELREVHRRVLDQDPALGAAVRRPSTRRAVRERPRRRERRGRGRLVDPDGRRRGVDRVGGAAVGHGPLTRRGGALDRG